MNRRFLPLLLVSVLTAVLLSGCTFTSRVASLFAQIPTATPTPMPTAIAPTEAVVLESEVGPEACLAGSWELKDPITLLNTAMPADLVQQYQLQLGEANGVFHYTFSDDGTIIAQAADFTVSATGVLSDVELDGTAYLNGSAAADYRVDESDGNLYLSNPVSEGFSVLVKVGPLTVVPETPVGDSLWLGSLEPGEAFVSFTCSGDALTIDIPSNPHTTIEALEFQRVIQ